MRRRFGKNLFVAMVITALTPLWAEAIPFTVEGNSVGAPDAVATGDIAIVGNTLSFSLTNTSSFDTRITGIGFDLVAGDFSGNNSTGLDGFSGANVGGFTFRDLTLKNVPQFSAAVLDFGFHTSNNGSFNGGSPNDGLAPGGTLNFSVTGNFGALDATDLASRIFVRFQRVGANGQGSDVGRGTPDEEENDEEGGEEEGGNVPEPASLLLLASAIAAGAHRLRGRRA